MGRQVDVRRFRGRGGERYVRRRVLEFIGIGGSFLGESEGSFLCFCYVIWSFLRKRGSACSIFGCCALSK